MPQAPAAADLSTPVPSMEIQAAKSVDTVTTQAPRPVVPPMPAGPPPLPSPAAMPISTAPATHAPMDVDAGPVGQQQDAAAGPRTAQDVMMGGTAPLGYAREHMDGAERGSHFRQVGAVPPKVTSGGHFCQDRMAGIVCQALLGAT